MTHGLLLSFFQGKYLTILGLMAVGLLSFGLSQSLAQTTITLDTTKSSYKPGDLVEIKGQVADSPNKLVAVEVKDPSGNTIMIRTVQTDAEDNFVLQFKLPSTAKSGSYDIITNTKVNGNAIKETKTITEASVVPEFPLSTGIIMVIVLAMGVAITKFKNLSLDFIH